MLLAGLAGEAFRRPVALAVGGRVDGRRALVRGRAVRAQVCRRRQLHVIGIVETRRQVHRLVFRLVRQWIARHSYLSFEQYHISIHSIYPDAHILHTNLAIESGLLTNG